jgi:hypothetical protein
MSITINSGFEISSIGDKNLSLPIVALDDSYPTGGYPLSFTAVGFSGTVPNATDNGWSFFTVGGEGGFAYEYDFDNEKLKVFEMDLGTLTNGTSAVTGTGTFLGTSAGSLNLATPAFSGTGLTAVGQVITTTDNQTMTLNQCAGMWLISATGATPPNLILSNTAVAGAPAALTVQGAASPRMPELTRSSRTSFPQGRLRPYQQPLLPRLSLGPARLMK